MEKNDIKMWKRLLEWGRCRAGEYLKLLEAENPELFDGSRGFSQTVLGLEIHLFFQEGAAFRTQEAAEGVKAEGSYFGVYQMAEPEGSLSILCRMFHLDEFECFCVIMTMLGELEYNFEKLFVYLNNDWNQRLFSVEWAVKLYTMRTEIDISYLHYFLPGSKLSQSVFDINSEGCGSGLRIGLKLKKSVLEYLLCSGGVRDKPYLTWNPPYVECSREQLEANACRRIEYCDALDSGSQVSRLIRIRGKSKEEMLPYPVWYAKEQRQAIGILDYACMLEETEPEQPDRVLEEVELAQGMLCIHNMEPLVKEEREQRKWSAFLRKAAAGISVVFVISVEDLNMAFLPSDIDYVPVELTASAFRNQKEWKQRWKQMAGNMSAAEEVLEQLSKQYMFSGAEIKRSMQEAKRLAYEKNTDFITTDLLDEACRKQLRHRLKEWAVYIPSIFTWEDLVLPKEQIAVLKEAVNQMKYRKQVYEDWGFEKRLPYGTGLSILLSGPPGTGKTMTAQVISGALGMELYKIQLPAVVSKYIGETEKNLNAIFQEGKKSHSVLFFDEADVLFGKRTEVKDSHDKYSNMEAAYLLQNMEEYTGVVILATNFLQNIDDAFVRRMKFTMEFYMPNREQRYFLWKQSFPKEVPLDVDVDLEWLANHFELSGSNIKNIAVNAAFLAAPEPSAVGMRHMIRALQNEYKKSGKMLSKEEIHPYEDLMFSC